MGGKINAQGKTKKGKKEKKDNPGKNLPVLILKQINFRWFPYSSFYYHCSTRFTNDMKPENISDTAKFVLLGLSDDPHLQPILLGLFLSMYLVTVLGNLLIILAVISDSHLHTPMYFFLSNLSLADICFITTTVPKMIVNISTHSRVISYVSCLTQMSLFIIFGCMDAMLLTVMAYDRFVAICHPLRYNVIMNPKVCWLLVLLSFIISVLDALLHTSMALQLSFCTNLEISHFFCELDQLLKIACSDILINSMMEYLVTGLLGVVPLSGIIFSYTQIVSSVLKIPSAGGKYKAFSICGSHLIGLSLFYGTGFGVYLSSTGLSRMDQPPGWTSSAPIALNPQALGWTESSCTGRFTNNMKFKNQTSVSEFLLVGLTDDPELQPLIFNLFLFIYLVTILGNLLIILAISSDSHLHTPMYFFLSNLSLTDICISTSTIPKMLVNIQTEDQRISYTGCFSQICFVLVFGCLENCLLLVMAYDRYVAICHPLRYTVIMHPRLCVLLVLLSLLLSIVHGLLHSLAALPLSFCTNVEIPHFFCELAQIIKLAYDPDLQSLIFCLFLVIYLVTILGNLLIILTISSDSHLHIPMYFFLFSLSFTDICISTTTIPMMLVNIQTQDQSITYTGCFTQSTCVLTFGGLESCLLAVMAYDHYVAICQPLRYQVILTPDFCILLVLLFLLLSTGHALLHTLTVLRLSFCTNVEIPLFFCELAQIFKLACSDTFVNTLLIYSAANMFFGFPIAGIIVAYSKIASSVFRMSSLRGRCLHETEPQNFIRVSEFRLMKLVEDPDQQPILLGLFLSMYLVTVFGNLLITLTIIFDSHLHTPMYFFLSNLSLADICFISTTVPKMIANILTRSTVISYVGCLTQMSLLLFFGCMDDMLLTVMAFDRFVAICHPLHYHVIMNFHLCLCFVLVSFLFSILESQIGKEEVHGCVEVGVRDDSQDDEQVPKHCDQVHGQEQLKEKGLKFWIM
ncbi:Olfactory receptor 7G3 [Fukomys damarensis]|uniref:Olfactory receptor 7G3 n=1 Tax=Fukomys damarensis TaxID=885580 RepID=A0A091DHD7_FUKDA|nr:Olfactory receptor 7G3 [Fukomys damarensis]